MIETDSQGCDVEVDDLDREGLLSFAADAERQARAAERRRLRVAYQ